jgi:class 3 adenylate cyclase
MARTQSVTIMFCDLVASTERRARLGDDAYDEFSARLFVVLRRTIADAGGREVSNAGDGMMIVFPESVADAVSCASAMHREAALLDADDPPRLRIGLSCGEVAQDGDQFSGMPIVEAARLESAAAPGQTLANAVVRALVGTRRALRFRDVGALTLKGIPEPLATVEVVDGEVATVAELAAAPVTASTGTKRRGRVVGAGIAVALVAVAAVAIALAVGHDHGSSASSPGTGNPHYKITYAPASCPPSEAQSVPGLQCGTLTVPEDRSKPNGNVVTLSVYRAPPRDKGTGDPVLDFGADNLATSPARDHAEEIQVAQRGWSGPLAAKPALTCPEYSQVAADGLTKPADDPAEQRREAAALRSCHDRWVRAGVDLDQYNYLAVGDDMADLVRALHLDHVNLVSGYVATLSALEVIHDLPGVVRTLTLQEPVAPGESAFTNPTKFLSDAFNNYVSLCRSDDACRNSFPDLSARYRHDFEVYSRAPRVVEGDDGQGHHHAVLIDGARVAMALQNALSRRATYPLIAAVVAATERSGAVDSAIGGTALDVNGDPLQPDFAWGAALSGQCSYERHTIDDTGSAISRQTLPEFSGADTGYLQWACRAWAVREIGSSAFDDPSTTVPTMIVVPKLLPLADPGWADIFRRGLPNATVLTFATLDGDILGAGDPPCLAALRRAFLADPAKPLAVTSCERQSPPIQFLASLGG